jgi:hypothetical protein
MSSSTVVPDDAKDEFWAVVEDCLREFHGMKPDAIRRKAGKLRQAIERMTPSELESFYHSEPFDVACDIAEDALNITVYLDRYLQIRDERHGTGISAQTVHGRRNANLQP